MEENVKYVIYPHEEEETTGLKPADKLIYLVIRRYMNKDTMTAFPSYATITKDCGAAAKTIKNCVNNLIKEGYLQTERDGKRIVYKFNNKKKFEPFSYEFLDNPNLNFVEKSYIVASQQYMFKENEEGKISYTNKELSGLIKMNESTISRCNHSLQKKGFLNGASDLIKTFNLRELDQLFVWKFKEHEDRLDDIETRLAKLEEENKKLRKDNENLRKSKNKREYIL